MTSTGPQPVAPRWNGRNNVDEGFVSPARLAQWKQEHQRATHEFNTSRPLSPPAPPPDNSPPALERRPSSNGVLTKSHHRSKPSFSFWSRKSTLMDDTPSPPTSRPSHGRVESVQTQDSFRTAPQTLMDSAASPQPHPPQRMPSNAVVLGPPGETQSSLTRAPTNGPPPLHPEIRSVVQLTLAHAHKVYFSGPLVRRLERQPDGQKPAKDEGWREVWAQLGGTTLSVWDMEEIKQASAQGTQAPPSYINVTDAVLGSITLPPTNDGPPRRYTNVLTLNTAGSNMYLFSCPSPQALVSWTAALRLAAWEKSRLEEIYTAHLLRITLNDGRNTPTTLINGRLEGWVRIRIAGQTDWKRYWMVISAGTQHQGRQSISSADARPDSPNAPRKRRMSDFFNSHNSQRANLPSTPLLQVFQSQKPKDRKKPLLTMREVTQAFAVYPERPELISRSTLMKLEGFLGDEAMAGGMRLREAWLLVMPELEGGNMRASEMLKWLIAIHDACELYGRPNAYSWDPRDPNSMMFAYPIGPQRDLLFLDREFAETLEARDDRTSAVRSRLQKIIFDRMNGIEQPPAGPPPPMNNGAPSLPPIPSSLHPGQQRQPQSNTPIYNSMQLPPLSFDSAPIHEESPSNSRGPTTDKRTLTPITERSVPTDGNSRSLSLENPTVSGSMPRVSPSTIPEEPTSILGEAMASSPVAASSLPDSNAPRPSIDSYVSLPAKRNVVSRSQSATVQQSPAPPYTRQPDSSSAPSTPLNRPFQTTSPPPQRPQPPSTTSSHTDPTSSVRMVSPRSTSDSSASIYTLPTTPASRISQGQSRFDQGKEALPPTPQYQEPSSQKAQAEHDDILGDAGAALYYMQTMQQEGAIPPRHRPPPLPKTGRAADDDETESSSSESEAGPLPYSASARTPPSSPPRFQKENQSKSSLSTPPLVPAKTKSPARKPSSKRAPSPPSSATMAAPVTGQPRPGMLRKPSGARAAPATRLSAYMQSQNSFSDQTPGEETASQSQPSNSNQSDVVDKAPTRKMSFEDPNQDALAALSFLEQDDPAHPSQQANRSPGVTVTPPPVPAVVETPASPSGAAGSGAIPRSASSEPRSSFAPTRLAAERKAKSEAQQAAQKATLSRPGKSNGKGNMRRRNSAAWGDSSEEEEEDEEEEDDDEDVDSDGEAPPRSGRSEAHSALGSGVPSSLAAGRSPYGGGSNNVSPTRSASDLHAGGYPPSGRGRDLPQVPPGQRGDEYLGAQPQQRRYVSDQMSEAGRRSMYPEGAQGGPYQQQQQFGQQGMRSQSEFPKPGAARQNIWSQVLDPNHGAQETIGTRDTFIQMEAPAATMTKAFTPHGLLSAGLQDKQDRSARRQEEIARESGASLINVPNKPPPPQTGLLGAVTAHERERKREGGLGAALTERERDKRLVEERQRKLDDFQRQQYDQIQQGGSMYGGMGMGYNPMMANPMMMGMNPMMTGGWGYPGMMPFANPQQMMAAQQAAAQAYQSAMIAYSTAGSQIGGDGPNPGQLNPMMTGGSMMGGFDPRMSMMSMPMMGGMGGMGAMTPNAMGGMGMNPMMGQMGMQMTGGGMGGSVIEPRFSPADGQRYPSQSSSPAPQGSPAGPRPIEGGPVDSPRNASPNPTPAAQ